MMGIETSSAVNHENAIQHLHLVSVCSYSAPSSSNLGTSMRSLPSTRDRVTSPSFGSL